MAKKTFAPANTFTPGETNARAVRAPAPTTGGKPGARTSDTAPLPKADDTSASDTDTATEAAADQGKAGAAGDALKAPRTRGTRSAAKKRK